MALSTALELRPSVVSDGDKKLLRF